MVKGNNKYLKLERQKESFVSEIITCSPFI